MISRTFIAILLAFTLPSLGSAADVSTIISCKPDGEFWLCGAWRRGQVEVFRSETYITQVEFEGSADAQLQAAIDGNTTGRTVESIASAPTYTLQLLACRVPDCLQKTGLTAIPETNITEIKRSGKHWYVLSIGEYVTTKAAQQAAAELMKKYSLRDKPWVRTLDSLNQYRISP